MAGAIKLLTYEQKRDIARKNWRAFGAGQGGALIGGTAGFMLLHFVFDWHGNVELLALVVGMCIGFPIGVWWYKRGQTDFWWLCMLARYPDLRRRIK